MSGQDCNHGFRIVVVESTCDIKKNVKATESHDNHLSLYGQQGSPAFFPLCRGSSPDDNRR